MFGNSIFDNSAWYNSNSKKYFFDNFIPIIFFDNSFFDNSNCNNDFAIILTLIILTSIFEFLLILISIFLFALCVYDIFFR